MGLSSRLPDPEARGGADGDRTPSSTESAAVSPRGTSVPQAVTFVHVPSLDFWWTWEEGPEGVFTVRHATEEETRMLEEKARNAAEVAGLKAETPRERLLRTHQELAAEALSVMRRKNEDYGATDDPFRNFRGFGTYGILVRLSDKLARLRTFEERGEFSVEDEGVRDTALDGLNYLVLYLAMHEFGEECK